MNEEDLKVLKRSFYSSSYKCFGRQELLIIAVTVSLLDYNLLVVYFSVKKHIIVASM